MKRILIPFLLFSFTLYSCNPPSDESSQSDQDQAHLEMLKALADMYHNLDPANIDSLFTEDFTGYGENGHTWDRESHRGYLSSDSYKVDNVKLQVAEGDWVCTHFKRTMLYQGDTITVPMMQFKHFKGDKIFELWEYYDFDFSASGDE